MYYYCPPKSNKVYVSTLEIDKPNEFNYPWKYIVRFTSEEHFKMFETFLREKGVNLKGYTKVKKENDDLVKHHWYDMPEYIYDVEDDFEFAIELNYRIEDESEVFKILPLDKVRKLKTPLSSIKKGQYASTHKKYSTTYEVPDIQEWRKALLNKEYECDLSIKPKYPIYVISLSRFEPSRHLTISWLEKSKIKYYLVVEPQEQQQYKQSLSKLDGYGELLITPSSFHLQKRGGVPVRNFVYNHSKNVLQTKRHWILDDNIKKYERRNRSVKKTVYGGATFRSIEEYVDRFINVRIAGHQYSSFSPPKTYREPVSFTRCFSSILVSNEFEDEELWKGKYNEDLDLSIREWIAGRPVMLFNHIVCDKVKTGLIKGGNQVDIYKNNWQYEKTKEIVDRYKDVEGIIVDYAKEKFGREIHHSFKILEYRVPILREDELAHTVSFNEWGMKLV